MPRVQLDSVDAYYAVSGEGPAVVLLHGGIIGGDSFGAQVPALAERYRVYVPDRRGHGRTPDVEGPITYDLMADETIAFLEIVVREPAHLVGWSDGGILALLVAMRRPELVRRVVAMGANFHHDGLIADSGIDDGSERPLYEATSVDGPDHWPVFHEKIVRMWQEEPTLTVADVATITAPTLVLAGDDEPIHLGHTTALYEALPAGQLAIVPGTSHLFALEKSDLTNRLILDFLAEQAPPATLYPVRRKTFAAPGGGTGGSDSTRPVTGRPSERG